MHARGDRANRQADIPGAQGHLDTYRFCDEVWTFIIKDVKFKLDNQHTVEAERVKIVACQSKDKAQ